MTDEEIEVAGLGDEIALQIVEAEHFLGDCKGDGLRFAYRKGDLFKWNTFANARSRGCWARCLREPLEVYVGIGL